MPRDTQAYLAVDFEPARRCEEAETWGPERVCWWEGDAAVVQAGSVGCWSWGSGEGEVPVVEVVVGDWGGGEVGAWVFVDIC